jgi:hypothetical protein
MKVTLLLFFISVISSQTLDSLDWIIGEWQSTVKNTIYFEKWVKQSNHTFEGFGEIKTKIKKSEETLRLVHMSGDIFYIAKVTHNKFPVAFRLISASNKKAVFENKEHDFPKRIEYSINNTTLNVYVSDGDSKGFTILYKKVVRD